MQTILRYNVCFGLSIENTTFGGERVGQGVPPKVFISVLLEAETLKVEADRAQVEAIFAYHDFLTNLEAVVGTSLRIE